MKVSLISIGNSQGIRLPKAVIEQAGLTPELELKVGDGHITIWPVGKPRLNWEKEAEACHAANDDALDEWDATHSDFEDQWE